MRPTRRAAAAAVASAVVLGITAQAEANHRPPLPKFTQKQAVKLQPVLRKRVDDVGYPMHFPSKNMVRQYHLGRDQLKQGRAKDGKIVWSKIKEQAQLYWVQLHPKSDQYLYWLYDTTGDHLRVIWATWEAIDVEPWRQSFYFCSFDHEGGYDHMDVMFGGNRVNEVGLPPGNAVLSPGQIRPAWVTVWEHGGFYREDYWTWHKVHLITDPVTNAKITASINPDQWAASTRARCS